MAHEFLELIERFFILVMINSHARKPATFFIFFFHMLAIKYNVRLEQSGIYTCGYTF